MVSLQFNTRFGIYLYITALVIIFSTGSEIGGTESKASPQGVVRYHEVNR